MLRDDYLHYSTNEGQEWFFLCLKILSHDWKKCSLGLKRLEKEYGFFFLSQNATLHMFTSWPCRIFCKHRLRIPILLQHIESQGGIKGTYYNLLFFYISVLHAELVLHQTSCYCMHEGWGLPNNITDALTGAKLDDITSSKVSVLFVTVMSILYDRCFIPAISFHCIKITLNTHTMRNHSRHSEGKVGAQSVYIWLL